MRTPMAYYASTCPKTTTCRATPNASWITSLGYSILDQENHWAFGPPPRCSSSIASKRTLLLIQSLHLAFETTTQRKGDPYGDGRHKCVATPLRCSERRADA